MKKLPKGRVLFSGTQKPTLGQLRMEVAPVINYDVPCARPITPQDQPKFPCDMLSSSNQWISFLGWYARFPPDEHGYTHWRPTQPEAPEPITSGPFAGVLPSGYQGYKGGPILGGDDNARSNVSASVTGNEPPVIPSEPASRAAPDTDDTSRIDFLDKGVFCAFRLDNGFITIGLPNGVAGSGLTLREAIDDLAKEQLSYENERYDHT